jgi:hypothetical protein
MSNSFDLARVLSDLRQHLESGAITPAQTIYLEVPGPNNRPLYAATVAVGDLGKLGPRAAAPRKGPPPSLDRVEKLVLLTLGRAYPEPLTLEEMAAKAGRGTSTLKYRGRLRRLQDELHLVENDGDHAGYRLSEEGELVAGDLLAAEEPDA